MRLYSKGVQPTLALFKALFVWLMWSLRAALRRGSFSRPWLGCKRWARVRFSWTRGRHACSVSANRAGARNFWYVQPDCVNNRPVNPGGARGWPWPTLIYAWPPCSKLQFLSLFSWQEMPLLRRGTGVLFLHPHQTGHFSEAHCSFASATGTSQMSAEKVH